MKKTKIKQRFAHAVDAFLADENSIENNLESYGNENDFWRKVNRSNSLQKSSSFKAILKQVFLFFPGTFLVWGTSLALSFNYFVWQPQNYLKIFILIVGSLMMIGGIGDLRKLKHLVIPLSAIGVCAALFIISLYTTGSRFLMNTAIYFFPLLLIAPFLAKGLVDRKDKN